MNSAVKKMSGKTSPKPEKTEDVLQRQVTNKQSPYEKQPTLSKTSPKQTSPKVEDKVDDKVEDKVDDKVDDKVASNTVEETPAEEKTVEQ